MYKNVIIYGKAEKLYGVGPFSSDRKMSNQSNNERLLSNEFKTINSSNAGGARHPLVGADTPSRRAEMKKIYEQSSEAQSKAIIADNKDCFSNNAESEFNVR